MANFDLNNALELVNTSAQNLETCVNYISVTDAFRFLRNSCGTNPESQNEIIGNSNVLTSTRKILLKVLTSRTELTCLQVGLQFVANLLVNNKKNQEIVWLSCQDLLNECLKFNDVKVQNCCAMILYNIFLGKPDLVDGLVHPLEDLIELTAGDTSEFALFTLELFVLKTNYIQKFYSDLKPESRLIVMEVIHNLITEQCNPNIKPETIKFFVCHFIKNSDCILKTTEKYAESLDAVETVKSLDLLVAFSSDDQQTYFKIVQEEMSLLINSVLSLRNIHLISKQTGNEFSMLSKITDYEDLEEKNISVEDHPYFGFKCSLIRLIGNLCWKNSKNQDKIRELECIPVLLDCCNMDARNPFIIQWCILAIRNICEKNYKNQEVIACISKEGKIDAGRLREMGIVLNGGVNGDALCLAPLKIDKQ